MPIHDIRWFCLERSGPYRPTLTGSARFLLIMQTYKFSCITLGFCIYLHADLKHFTYL